MDINQTYIWELCFEKEKMQPWLVEAFCWCVFKVYLGLLWIYFSSGYFRQLSKQKAAITYLEELEIYCIAYKLECNCLDWANKYFVAIFCVFSCTFMVGTSYLSLLGTGLWADEGVDLILSGRSYVSSVLTEWYEDTNGVQTRIRPVRELDTKFTCIQLDKLLDIQALGVVIFHFVLLCQWWKHVALASINKKSWK